MSASRAPSFQRKEANFNRVSPGYFGTMETPFIAGRDFDDRDAERLRTGRDRSPRRSPVLSSPGLSPIGRVCPDRAGGHVGRRGLRFRIVGLVKDTKYGELREDFSPIVFLPMAQDDPSLDMKSRSSSVRTCRSRRFCRRWTSAFTGVSPDISRDLPAICATFCATACSP